MCASIRAYRPGARPGPSFFTRWVTHFCAPAFALFAGSGAYLYGRKLGNTPRAGAIILLARGLLLVLLEMTVIRLAWTFNLDYGNFALAGVIWMLGWSMILLAGLVWLPACGESGADIGLAINFSAEGLRRTYLRRPWSGSSSIPSGGKAGQAIAILYVWSRGSA